MEIDPGTTGCMLYSSCTTAYASNCDRYIEAPVAMPSPSGSVPAFFAGCSNTREDMVWVATK